MEHLIDNLIEVAFKEDIREGDHTIFCCILESAFGQVKLVIKEAGIFARS